LSDQGGEDDGPTAEAYWNHYLTNGGLDPATEYIYFTDIMNVMLMDYDGTPEEID
jgi:hypothetical protein